MNVGRQFVFNMICRLHVIVLDYLTMLDYKFGDSRFLLGSSVSRRTQIIFIIT